MMRVAILFLIMTPFWCTAQDATINYSRTTYEFASKGKYTLKKHFSITIHNKNGDHFSEFHDYEDDFRKMSSFKMTLLDENGNKVQKYGKIDLIEYSFDASYHIDDMRSLYLNPSCARYPYTLEVEAQWNVTGILGIPVWMPQPYFKMEVKDAELEILVPNEVDLRIKNVALENAVDVQGALSRYYWHLEDMPAIDDNMNYQIFFDQQPKAYLALTNFEIDGEVGSTESWRSFGQWMYDLNAGRGGLSMETINFLKSLDTSDKRQAIQEVYQYMQDRTRYVSIQLGIGGWQTIPSLEVDKKGYGDCKALTYYTMSMLSQIGIESNGVLVRAGRQAPKVNEDFPSNQFNHIFLGVPMETDTIYLECTSQTQPFSYLGSFTDDRYVLWVGDGNSRLIKSPIYDEKTNLKETKAEVLVSENGDAKLKLKTLNKGYFSDDFVSLNALGDKRFEQFATDQFEYSDFVIHDYELEPRSRNQPKYYAKYNVEVKGLGKVVDENLMIPSNTMNPIEHYVDYSRYDKYAEIRRAFRIKDDVDIIPPKNTFIETIPESQVVESPYGTYELKIERQEGNIHIIREFQFNKGKYTQEEFDQFFRYLRKVSKIEKRYLVLNSKT